MSDFRKKTISGISWSVVSQVSNQVITFGFGIVLARLLAPPEFGLVAMVTVFSGFALLFADMGLGAAIVNRQTEEQIYLSSIFWINTISGILLTILFYVSAPVVAAFYSEPELLSLTRFISISFLLSAFGIVQETLLEKRLEFRKLAYIEISAQCVSGLLTVVMAILGYGVWSLATRSIVFLLTKSVLLWTNSTWHPKFIFSWSKLVQTLGFGANLLGSNSLAYWMRNIDNFLIGATLGAETLGIYARAYAIMLLPLTMISDTISRSLFPSLSIIQNDKIRVKDVYLNITGIVALFAFPISFGLFIVAQPFVLTVYGPSWGEVIPLLQVFCLTSPVLAIGNLTKNVYWSQGRTDLQFRVSLIYRTVKILALIVGLHWGILGVAAGFSLSTLFSVYIDTIFVSPLINLDFKDLFRVTIGPFACATAMVLIAWLLGLVIANWWPTWMILAAKLVLSIAVYYVLVSLTNLQSYRSMRALLSDWILHRSTHSASVSIP